MIRSGKKNRMDVEDVGAQDTRLKTANAQQKKKIATNVGLKDILDNSAG